MLLAGMSLLESPAPKGLPHPPLPPIVPPFLFSQTMEAWHIFLP